MNTATLARASDADFELVTDWHIAADIDAVWQALNHPDYWPRWWPYVRSVEKLRAGDAEGVGSLYRIEWTSKLPYDITFEVETVEVARYERIQGLARGQLNGQGVWELSPDESSTRVRYTWSVNLVEPWMRRLRAAGGADLPLEPQRSDARRRDRPRASPEREGDQLDLKPIFACVPSQNGLFAAAAAATQTRAGDARDDAAGAADDLQIAADRERTVRLRIDREHAVAHRQHVGLAARRLARRVEADFVVRAVAERLVLRGAAAAQRRAKAARLAVDLQLAAERVRPALAHAREVDGRRRLVAGAVVAAIADRTRRTGVRDLDDALDRHRVGMNPRSLHVREKHLRRAGDAEARVDAALGFEHQLQLLALHVLDAVDDRRGRRG